MNITLTWEQNDKYWLSSENYRISIQGPHVEPVCVAWFRGKPWKRLDAFHGKDGISKAKAACELHYLENMK